MPLSCFLILLIILLIILIIFIIVSVNCNNKESFREEFTNSNACYDETWGSNSVGYKLTAYPSIENYSYQSYDFNLNNTPPPSIPYEFGVTIQAQA